MITLNEIKKMILVNENPHIIASRKRTYIKNMAEVKAKIVKLRDDKGLNFKQVAIEVGQNLNASRVHKFYHDAKKGK